MTKEGKNYRFYTDTSFSHFQSWVDQGSAGSLILLCFAINELLLKLANAGAGKF